MTTNFCAEKVRARSGKRLARLTAVTLLAVAANIVSAETAATTPAEAQFSAAEVLLWTTDQLKQVKTPTRLDYVFTKSGTLEAGFTDKVVFTIEKVKSDGMKAAKLDFFTGERHFPVPPEENTNVNPVLKVYLQGDVYEMNRLTDPDGKARERWRYFQRQIKFAMAEGATITPLEIEVAGRRYKAQRVTFAPYVNDPKREQFAQLAGKRYSITVAEDLPGYLYEIETEVPGATHDSAPLIKETLRLTAVSPLDAS